MEGLRNGKIEMEEWMDRWMDGRMDGWMKEGNLFGSVCPEEDGQTPSKGVEQITTDG